MTERIRRTVEARRFTPARSRRDADGEATSSCARRRYAHLRGACRDRLRPTIIVHRRHGPLVSGRVTSCRRWTADVVVSVRWVARQPDRTSARDDEFVHCRRPIDRRHSGCVRSLSPPRSVDIACAVASAPSAHRSRHAVPRRRARRRRLSCETQTCDTLHTHATGVQARYGTTRWHGSVCRSNQVRHTHAASRMRLQR
jgi:hypothetical protein